MGQGIRGACRRGSGRHALCALGAGARGGSGTETCIRLVQDHANMPGAVGEVGGLRTVLAACGIASRGTRQCWYEW